MKTKYISFGRQRKKRDPAFKVLLKKWKMFKLFTKCYKNPELTLVYSKLFHIFSSFQQDKKTKLKHS